MEFLVEYRLVFIMTNFGAISSWLLYWARIQLANLGQNLGHLA